MKKFSELKFKRINMENLSNKFNQLIDEFKNASSFEEQNND